MKEAIFAIIKVSVIVVIVFVLGCGGGSDDDDGGANVVPVQVKNADGVGALHIEVIYDSSIVEVLAFINANILFKNVLLSLYIKPTKLRNNVGWAGSRT